MVLEDNVGVDVLEQRESRLDAIAKGRRMDKVKRQKTLIGKGVREGIVPRFDMPKVEREEEKVGCCDWLFGSTKEDYDERLPRHMRHLKGR